MVTIKKIAEVSGFSQATVSRLLNGDESLSIAEETKHQIVNTALSLGYSRSKIKTTLEKIAVLFRITEQEELLDVYFHKLKLSLEKYGKDNNLAVQFLNHEDDFSKIDQNVQGFIGVGAFTSEELHILKQTQPNGVILEVNPQPELFDTVKPDTDRMTRLALKHFLEKGYRQIGFIGGSYFNPDTHLEEFDSRELAFRAYLSQVGLLDETLIFSGGHFTVEQGYELTIQLINTLDTLPEAFFIASDTIAVGALQAFNEKNIAIPETLEMISINDNDIAKFVAPPLTTFRIEVDEIAKTAIDLLVEQMISSRTITKTVLIGSELIIRKSFIPTKVLN